MRLSDVEVVNDRGVRLYRCRKCGIYTFTMKDMESHKCGYLESLPYAPKADAFLYEHLSKLKKVLRPRTLLDYVQ